MTPKSQLISLVEVIMAVRTARKYINEAYDSFQELEGGDKQVMSGVEYTLNNMNRECEQVVKSLREQEANIVNDLTGESK